MPTTYKSFVFNDADSVEPWVDRELQASKDIVDTIVLDACTQTEPPTPPCLLWLRVRELCNL